MVEYMDETILLTKHGRANINPFITLQFKMSFRRIMVFNCQIENNSEIPVEFILKHVELEYGGTVDHAHNVNFIMNYFEQYKDNEGLSDSDFLDKENTAKKYVITEKTTIQPGSKITGYLVFMDKYPQHGDGMLSIPIFTSNDALVTVFDFPYSFDIYN